MNQAYLHPTQDAGRALIERNLRGPVVMLYLLRFRAVADYSASPELAPDAAISGAEAYGLYAQHALPLVEAAGGEVLFNGQGGPTLIGPSDEHWDQVLLVRHLSVAAFLAFARDPAYLKGVGHRTAALADSRLLPMTA